MSDRLDIALLLARRGFYIFPLMPATKRPYPDEGWKAMRSRDESVIRRWFDTRPDMNYAVNCDEHHVVLDLDEGLNKKGDVKDGIAQFQAAADDADDWSAFHDTFRVRTPKGGVHLYYACDKGYANSVGKIMPWVDVRGPDGYVVGPGCTTFDDPAHSTAEGDYLVEVPVAIADLPDWIKIKLDAEGVIGTRSEIANSAAMEIDSAGAIASAIEVLRSRKVATEGQGGDEHTYVTAALVKDYGVSEDKCLELMYHEIIFPPSKEYPEGRTWNEMCDPPWELGDAHSHGLAFKVHNAYRYGNRQIGAKMDALTAIGTAEVVVDPETGLPDPQSAVLGTGEQVSAIEQPIGVDEGAARIRESLIWSDAFMEKDFEIDSLIPEWIPGAGITALLGTRGGGKTVQMVDWAMSIATDTKWNDIEIAKDWSVVYLCGEDDVGLQRQIRAWSFAHGGIKPSPDRLLIAPAVPNLLDAHQVKLWSEELKRMFKGRRVVIFLDTWQRATSHGDQNDNKQMNQAIHHAEALSRYLNGCTVISFHPPKGREDTISGSMVMENATVCIIQLTSGSGDKKIEVTRIKGRGEGNYVRWRLVEVPLGDFEKVTGREVTGVVAEYSGGKTGGITQNEIDRLNSLRQQIGDVIDETLANSKRGLTYKEVAQLILAHREVSPESDVSKAYFGDDVDRITAKLHSLFNPSTVVTLDNLGAIHIENQKFVLRGVVEQPG